MQFHMFHVFVSSRRILMEPFVGPCPICRHQTGKRHNTHKPGDREALETLEVSTAQSCRRLQIRQQ